MAAWTCISRHCSSPKGNRPTFRILAREPTQRVQTGLGRRCMVHAELVLGIVPTQMRCLSLWLASLTRCGRELATPIIRPHLTPEQQVTRKRESQAHKERERDRNKARQTNKQTNRKKERERERKKHTKKNKKQTLSDPLHSAPGELAQTWIHGLLRAPMSSWLECA